MQSTGTQFLPGFRLSPVDVAVLVVGTASTAFLATRFSAIAFVVGFVVLHFFLFCNVFRLARPLELSWAGCFVLLVSATTLWNKPGWMLTVAISLLVTVVVIALELRKPSYHGIYWKRINPTLPDWWQAQHSSDNVMHS
jgi:hypothetical protein